MGTPSHVGTSGFWGLILEPGKRYTRLVDVPFHITAAVLDTITGGAGKDEIVSVMLEVDGMEVIICNLSLNRGIIQVPLNLKFDVGCKIAFYSTGTNSNIHLSGNVIGSKENSSSDALKTFEAEEEGESFSDDEMGEDSEDEEEEEDDDEDDDSDEETDSEDEVESKAQTTGKGKHKNNLLDSAAQTPKSGKNKMGKSPNTVAAAPKKEMEGKVQAQNGASQKQKGAENKNVKGASQTPVKTPKVLKMGGLSSTDLVVGTGVEAKHGKNVSVYYEGRLASNKKMFDKCYSGKPFKFRLGSSDIIKGWNVAINGMKVGGKRKFVCPPHLGYGNRGAPPAIPPNAVLEFVVELKAVG
ncbi:46 kDa FK506-binding nuclear protein-like isoform X3 [Macrobrachium rosenbergii]|uniref:46 kDa FK506-binding nuclear protein-like isoform X3 n=1 Tax=Macrobrachium rosenbergii TaxID=79674 RepID=UPI0034D41A4A